MVISSKFKALCLLLLLSSSVLAEKPELHSELLADSDTCETKRRHNNNCDDDDCDSTKLSIKKLCAKEIKAKCIHACKIKADEVCAKEVRAKDVHAENITSKNDCTENLTVTNQACINNLTSTNSSTNNLVAGNACVNNLTAGGFQACTAYKAAAVYSTLTTYNLGDFLNFDTIVDDPNHNLTTSPTIYTVPVTGYYIITIQIDQQNLVPNTSFGPILGVPVANPQLFVNGVLTRQLYSAYLTFFNQQRVTLTTLSKFNAGDQVQAKLELLAVNQTTGLTAITGTVDIIGNGSLENDSLFIIHYLSSDCQNPPCSPTGCTAPCTGATGHTGHTGGTGSTGHDHDCKPCDF